MTLRLAVPCIVVLLFAIPSSLSTPPQPYEFDYGQSRPGGLDRTFDHNRTPTIDHVREWEQICLFLDRWQVSDPTDPEFGGMIEDEYRTGADRIVESDNTQEAIFAWCRYMELTGSTQFDQNVTDAWTYLTVFPAWLEEPVHYALWNCAWGIQAHRQYQKTYASDAHRAYADQCAEFILTHDLSFQGTPPQVGYRNVFITAWAAYHLHLFASEAPDPDLIIRAENMATRVRDWLAEDPANILKTGWALSGGAAAAAVIHVLYHDDPEGALAYYEANLLDMPLYFDPADFNPSSWIHAWDSFLALAQNTLWRVTQRFEFRLNALEQSEFMRSHDGDGDGGIPPNPSMSDTEDHTWVSTYITVMGFDMLDEPSRVSLSMPDSSLAAGDRMEAGIQVVAPGLDRTADLYLVLEIANQFLFFPQFTDQPEAIRLVCPIGYDLAAALGFQDTIPFLTIDPWPSAGSFSATWWAALIDPATSELIGDLITLPWASE